MVAGYVIVKSWTMKCQHLLLVVATGVFLLVFVQIVSWRDSGLSFKGSSTSDAGTDLPKWVMSGATARAFVGDKTRKYSHDVLFRSSVTNSAPIRQLEPWCEKWGVVTTIFVASEAIKRQVHTRMWYRMDPQA